MTKEWDRCEYRSDAIANFACSEAEKKCSLVLISLSDGQAALAPEYPPDEQAKAAC